MRRGGPRRAAMTKPPPPHATLPGRERGVAARCDPRRCPRVVRARRTATMPPVASAAATVDALGDACACGTRGCSMLQAQCALTAKQSAPCL